MNRTLVRSRRSSIVEGKHRKITSNRHFNIRANTSNSSANVCRSTIRVNCLSCVPSTTNCFKASLFNSTVWSWNSRMVEWISPVWTRPRTSNCSSMISMMKHLAGSWTNPINTTPYFGYVEKTARPETPVFRFKAFDPDTTSKITYEIVHGDKNLFHLSSDGTLTTHSNQQLLAPIYNLTVRAIDLNSQVSSLSRSPEAHLLIRTDRFEPRFFREKYVFNVSEYTQPSTIVGTIRAKSFSTTNDHLRYFLQQPSSGGTQTFVQSSGAKGSAGDMYEFKIDETEGSIQILKMLRYSDQHNNNTKYFTGTRFDARSAAFLDSFVLLRDCQGVEWLAVAISSGRWDSCHRYQR